MNTHLTDFPTRPADVVPTGIHPAMVARTLGIDADRLARSLEVFGVDDVGAVEVRPHVNVHQLPARAAPSTGDGRRERAELPRIVAMRLDGQRLRAVRVGLDYSQESFAKAVKEAGARLGEPNGCTKRAVQQWESGAVTMPRPPLRRALAEVIGAPFVTLCTPVLPPDPSEATAELSAIAADMNDLIHRLISLYSYLMR